MRKGHPEEGKWVRIYLTLCGLYKLIIVKQPIELDSILDERFRKPFHPSRGPLADPVSWLGLVSKRRGGNLSNLELVRNYYGPLAL